MNKTNNKIKKLKKELDTLIQHKYVPLNPTCLVCGQPTSEMHHYIQKTQSTYLRWDKRNLIPLCKKCHCLHHIGGDPRIHQEIIRNKGHEWADELERDRRIISKSTLSNLQEVKEDKQGGA